MNQKVKLLSVIIPVYGVEKYISQCLESLINQTYKNIEIIVINDGTKDNSANIAKEYSAKDSRIKVYDYENGGISVARNRGLAKANGDFIAFLDSDDWVAPEMYSKLIQCLEDTNVDFVKCGIIEFNETQSDTHTFNSDKVMNADFSLYYGGFLNTVVWNAVYTRGIAVKVKYPENVVNEDNYATGMYIYYAKKVAFVKEAYHHYRINMSGVSKGPKKRPLDRFRAVYRLKQELLQKGFEDSGLDRRLAIDIYHYARDKNPLVRVKSMEKQMKDFVIKNLDLRRKIQFYMLCLKKNI